MHFRLKYNYQTLKLTLAPSNDIELSNPKNVTPFAGAALIIHIKNPGKNARIPSREVYLHIIDYYTLNVPKTI
jgi:hypothetical protein